MPAGAVIMEWLDWIVQATERRGIQTDGWRISCRNDWLTPVHTGTILSVMNTGDGSFPTTDWGLLANLNQQDTSAKLASLDILIRRYWKPVYVFLRRSGHPEERAKDLTQSFFLDWMEKDVFGKADPERGRFRTFMLTCLKRFAANVHRAEMAAIRRPEAGLVSLQELMENDHVPFEPSDHNTPDAEFQVSWAKEVIHRVLRRLEIECRDKGMEAHYDIMRSRLVDPILNGDPAIPTEDLARKYNLTSKQVFNHLETAKRSFRQLMKDEISLYAESPADVSLEMNDIFRVLGGMF
jgi:RNA polymerase sigma factor (sigma-70 family)